jgi:hypothetical protein
VKVVVSIKGVAKAIRIMRSVDQLDWLIRLIVPAATSVDRGEILILNVLLRG